MFCTALSRLISLLTGYLKFDIMALSKVAAIAATRKLGYTTSLIIGTGALIKEEISW
jgi:hypothetical protein